MSKDLMSAGKASWITFPRPEEAFRDRTNPWETAFGVKDIMYKPIDDQGGVALFRCQFEVNAPESARIDATALGVYELWCNGRRVGRVDEDGETVYDEMKPGWTDYEDRVLFYSYDLTTYLSDGVNTLVAAVAPGWYDGRINNMTYGETHVAFLAAIHLFDAAGARDLYTGSDWCGAWGSAIRASDIWDGELYDANLPTPAGLSTGCSCIEWGDVITEEHDLFVTPQVGPTIMVRKGLTRTPETIVIYNGTEDNGTEYGKIHVVRESAGEDHFALASDEVAVIDLGQNMVGRPAFTVRGKKGTMVRIRVGEMLNDSGSAARGNDNPEGSVYTINYRSAKAKLYYTLCGAEGGEAYCPNFTFYGFRYLEVTATEDVVFEKLECPVIGSATRETGRMETSDPMVNQLISNIIWGQRGNYLSVPTDCPQRDERLGWTGDTQAFCCTAAYNADVAGFFHKWLQDARDSQHENGMYPDVIPAERVVGFGGAAWSDAGIIVPYTMWKMYNDTDIVREHFASMERYMDWLATTNLRGPHPTYGDWLAYEPTDATYISTAYYALDAMYMKAMANAIGMTERAAHYAELYDIVRDHFRATYCVDGELKPEHRTQCGYLLALRIGLLAEEKRSEAVAALKKKIIDNGYKLSTGFVGSCILCEVLAENGENDLAYSLLLQTENPSWLYSIYQGATTIWERWNSYTKATGFGDVGMNSFNHYAYGAVQEWMYRHIAGIETTEEAPGFASPILQPKPDTRAPEEIPEGQVKMTWAKTSFDSASGLIVSNWDTTDGGLVYECTVPVAATLYLPILTEAETYTVNGVEKAFTDAEKSPCGKCIVVRLEAGSYIFVEK